MMTHPYHPEQIETPIQKGWIEDGCFRAKESLDKPLFYCLSMLPYPSGQLHMGHVRNYALGDALSRYKQLQGFHVLQPIGWDGFGLPAENAAKTHDISPRAWTKSNIEAMGQQLRSLGIGYDWQREIATCDPSFYRWNQWLFLQMLDKGLAYQKESVVNWDPVDQTVLANEQVVNGLGWRSGAKVEKRYIKQWFYKTTAYSDELLESIETLEGWPEDVKTMQKNWIGRSEGAIITFEIKGHDDTLSVFTTRADTLYGATYLGIAADHPLALSLAKSDNKIKEFIALCQQTDTSESTMATQEKKGIATPLMAKHPLTGDAIPVWITNYVLMSYGSGAVMAVPAHDERDFAFATTYDLPIQRVINSDDPLPFTGHGALINSQDFDGTPSTEAVDLIIKRLGECNAGHSTTTYRLRDWGISRQRYWGTPIPIIHCEHCGVVPVPEQDLPVLLPDQIDLNTEGSPLAHHDDFVQTNCPSCGEKARRETDTMDTFVDSSWYYLRYTCPDQHDRMLDDRANFWTPVDQYIGGIEHATMHLLYARFMHKVLRDLGLVNSDEPFTRLLTQGMVLKDGHKMSKSKGNVVAPMPLIEQYGADTIRLFALFAAPPEQSIEWRESGIEGAHRFLKRLWKKGQDWQGHLTVSSKPESFTTEEAAIRHLAHSLLKQATYDYERLQFNTVVSATMKLLNTLADMPVTPSWVAEELWRMLLRLLSPITPHITEHLWTHLGFEGRVSQASWPDSDPKALECATQTLVVQINGKRRGAIQVASDASDEVIKQSALNDPSFADHLINPPKKIIIVPGKLINIVVPT